MKSNSNNAPLNLISLFSGGGFLDIGFMNQGFQVSEAIEFHKGFVDCYNAGIKSYVSKSQKAVFKNGLVSAFNITSPTDATNYTVQSLLEKKYKNCTGIIGGPPCQDFSVGGKNKGTDGNRGKLIFTYLEIVNKVTPLFIFFENVAGLYNNKEHQIGYYKLKKELQKKYYLWDDILNSLEYGVPQDRARLTLVGFRRDVVEKLLKNNYKLIIESSSQNEELIFKWPEKKFKNVKSLTWPKMWSFNSGIITEDLKQIPEKYLSLCIASAFSNINDRTPNQHEAFVPYSKKFQQIAEGDTYRKSFKRLHRYRYSPTVAYGNNEVHLHPTEARRLTVREALRIQSISDNYILPTEVNLTDKFKLISNGVPAKKAELIAIEIKRTIQNYLELL